MPLVLLSLLFQIGLVVHAVRTGRDSKWIYLILIFPMVGGMAYLMVEVLPELGRSRTVRSAHRRLLATLDPERDLRLHSDALEIADTVENTLNLAATLRDAGRFEQARTLCERALAGAFRYDPALLLAKAQAEFGEQAFAAACQTLELLIAKNPDFRSADGHLLYAQALDGAGELAKARHEYETLISYFAGPEPKCLLAGLLLRQGERDQAVALYNEVLLAARRGGRHYQRLHGSWIETARKAVATP